VLGHEIVGRIVKFGEAHPRIDFAGKPLQENDRITWTVIDRCRQCFYCMQNLPQKCEQLQKYGHVLHSVENAFAGGLADYILLKSGTDCIRVPDNIPDPIATQASCSTATVAAIYRHAPKFQTVFIFGAGVLGLTAAAMAHASGAEVIAICDRDPVCLKRAGGFGAGALFDADLPTQANELSQLTHGRGFDLVIELAGTQQTCAAAIPLTRIGGTIIFAGTVSPTDPIPLDPELVVRRLLTIKGVHNYTSLDLQSALDFLENSGKNYPFELLVGETFPLSEVNAAFERARTTRGMRIVVRP
jgi:alcohol dehydrogenase